MTQFEIPLLGDLLIDVELLEAVLFFFFIVGVKPDLAVGIGRMDGLD